MTGSLEERFWAKVDRTGDCWEWRASRSAEGYGHFRVGRGRVSSAHRVALSWATGVPLTTNLKALHSCDNPPCVNPDHLRWGTDQDNTDDKMARGRAGGRTGMRLSRCKRGHEMTPENIYENSRQRRCRACLLAYKRQWYAATKAA